MPSNILHVFRTITKKVVPSIVDRNGINSFFGKKSILTRAEYSYNVLKADVYRFLMKFGNIPMVSVSNLDATHTSFVMFVCQLIKK